MTDHILKTSIVEAWNIWNTIRGHTAFDDLLPDDKIRFTRTLDAYAAHIREPLEAELAAIKEASEKNRLLCMCYWCGIADLSSHIDGCEKHPMRKMTTDLIAARHELAALRANGNMALSASSNGWKQRADQIEAELKEMEASFNLRAADMRTIKRWQAGGNLFGWRVVVLIGTALYAGYLIRQKEEKRVQLKKE